MKAFIQKYWGVAVVILAMVVGLVWGLIPDPDVSKRTATAPAEILSATETEWTEGGHLLSRRSKSSKYWGYRVIYEFQVDRQFVPAISDKNSWYKKGEQCRVCYEPGNPKNSDLRDATSGGPCGSKYYLPR